VLLPQNMLPIFFVGAGLSPELFLVNIGLPLLGDCIYLPRRHVSIVILLADLFLPADVFLI
jgi:hypothetical protein